MFLISFTFQRDRKNRAFWRIGAAERALLARDTLILPIHADIHPQALHSLLGDWEQDVAKEPLSAGREQGEQGEQGAP